MKIKHKDKNYCGMVFGRPFENGECDDDFSFEEVKQLKAIGAQIEIVDEDCPRCKKYKEMIEELKLKLEKKQKKEYVQA